MKTSKKDKRISDLEECLAGFMATAVLNGAYMSDDMLDWAKRHLKGKTRTPVQIWQEIAHD